MSFDYTSGNPAHLTGGQLASMADIQGEFTDLKTFLNARIAAIPTLVSSLPVSPVDAQEIYYLADATNGVVWHLRYRAASASTSKWEFVGGPVLKSNLAGSASTTGSGASYSGTLTDGANIVQLTVPLAGDYWVTTNGVAGVPGAGANLAMGVARNADATPTVLGLGFGGGGGLNGNLYGEGLFSGLAAGVLLVMKYLYTAQVVTFQQRMFTIRPVRVG